MQYEKEFKSGVLQRMDNKPCDTTIYKFNFYKRLAHLQGYMEQDKLEALKTYNNKRSCTDVYC